jgi:hypothetical protein
MMIQTMLEESSIPTAVSPRSTLPPQHWRLRSSGVVSPFCTTDGVGSRSSRPLLPPRWTPPVGGGWCHDGKQSRCVLKAVVFKGMFPTHLLCPAPSYARRRKSCPNGSCVGNPVHHTKKPACREFSYCNVRSRPLPYAPV